MAVVKIRKLTPPQIQALRDAYPYSVQVGLLTTTNSIATFDFSVIGEPEKGLPTVKAMVRHALWRDAVDEEGRFIFRPLAAVLAKIETRPELVTEHG